MKIFIIIIASFFIATVSFGQYVSGANGRVGIGDVPGSLGRLSINGSVPKDTIPVIIFYSDTASAFAPDVVLWAKAYSVIELSDLTRPSFGLETNYNRIIHYGEYWERLSYLDKNKKPLPKNIVVWQSKEL